jgi:hypothetical protein
MKRLFFVFLIVLGLSLRSLAVEGMWLPVLIGKNIEEMQAMGLNLTAEDLYNEDGVSLKDAIVRFGRGCTGSFISPEGLLLTNHHCGYGQIQAHSSVENDYLTHGFWAGSRDEELPNPGLTITMLVRMQDVTERVQEVLEDGMSEDARQRAVRNISRTIVDEATENGRYEAQVSPFYYGNEYYLFVFEVYRDVRLVGAPPSSVGKYGGDVDNWMWPRHSGDFALFRVYADSNNQPADYSPNNQPYRPAHFFPVSNQGREMHDFTMVYGFPGRTNQYLTSHEVDFIIERQNPAAIDIRTNILSMYEQEMAQSDRVRIQYATKHARVSNAWKRWMGENRGLHRLNAVNRKQQQEREFDRWAQQTGRQEYQGVMAAFDQVYADYLPYRFATTLYNEAGRGSEIVRFAQSFKDLVDMSRERKPNQARIREEVEKLQEMTRAHFRDYHKPIDKKVLEVLTGQYIALSDPQLMPEALRQVSSRFGSDLSGFADNIFSRSFLVSEEKTMNFLENYRARDYRKLESDRAYDFAVQLLNFYQNEVRVFERDLGAQLDSLYRLYTAGLREMEPERNFFPDANGTLRITYGRVEGSYPRDAVQFLHYTTGDGILEKAAMTEIEDYRIPARLQQLLEERRYGDFANNGELVVNFVGSNHTTGGNSGSPVIGANGELIGLNFDRSWESTMSDIMFDPEQCRNISVNSQYILWVVSQYAGMDYLLDEMVIISE